MFGLGVSFLRRLVSLFSGAVVWRKMTREKGGGKEEREKKRKREDE